MTIPRNRYTISGHWSESAYVDCLDCQQSRRPAEVWGVTTGPASLESMLEAVRAHENEHHST